MSVARVGLHGRGRREILWVHSARRPMGSGSYSWVEIREALRDKGLLDAGAALRLRTFRAILGSTGSFTSLRMDESPEHN